MTESEWHAGPANGIARWRVGRWRCERAWSVVGRWRRSRDQHTLAVHEGGQRIGKTERDVMGANRLVMTGWVVFSEVVGQVVGRWFPEKCELVLGFTIF